MTTQISIERSHDAPLVAPSDLAVFCQHAERQGADIEAILSKYQSQAEAGDQKILSLIDYFRIERDVARSVDDLTAHMSTRRLTYQTGTFVLNEVKKATTLQAAMSSLSSYFNMMHAGQYNSVDVTDRTITLSINDANFPYAMRDDEAFTLFVGECVQIKVHCLLDSLSDGRATKGLRKVGIVRGSDKTRNGHLRFWMRPPILNQSVYSLTYDLDVAGETFPHLGGLDLSSEGVLTRVINHLDQLCAELRPLDFIREVSELIDQGIFRQDIVAKKLSISTATLRRRLAVEDESFRKLVEQKRIDRAEKLLNGGHTVQHIADVLEYSDIRSFIRAFKRIKGVTPAKFFL